MADASRPGVAAAAWTAAAAARASLRSGLDRLGGPSATSWRSALAMLVLLVVDRLGTDLEGTGRALALLSSALAGGTAIAGVLVVARSTLLRTAADRPRPLRAMLTTGLAGYAAALVGRLHDTAIGLPAPPGNAYLVERTIWGFAFLNVLIIGLDALTEHRAELARLRTRTATLERTRAEVDALLTEGPRVDLEGIAAEVRADLAALAGVDRASALAHLRHAGEEVVRSRSHELARPAAPYRPSEPAPEARRSGLADIVLDATAEGPLSPTLVAFVTGLWVAVGGFGTVPPAVALGIGALVGLGAALTFGLIGRLLDVAIRDRSPRVRAVLGLSVPVVAALLWLLGMRAAIAGLELPLEVGSETVQPIRLAAQVVLLSAIPIAQGLGRAARRRGAVAVAEQRDLTAALEVEVARANAALWARRRALSRALHGPVQAAINAATLRLAGVGDGPRDGTDAAAIARARAEVEAALAALERTVADDALVADDDLADAIERIRGLWEGVTTVEVEVAPALATDLSGDPTARAAVIDALTEACSNAVRHGRARHVRAHLIGAADRVTLDVVDDGHPGPVGPPGQGSALLDEVAIGWRRSHAGTGTRLTATFARS